MATPCQYIIKQVRDLLAEPVPRFWSDLELMDIMNQGITDLWGAILDIHQDHYYKLDAVNCSIPANDTEVRGLPQDCFRVTLIEPRDTSVTGVGHQVLFVPRKYNHPDFIIARTLDAQDPDALPSRQLYYEIVGQGSPIEPPHILVAPLLSATLPLRITYNPTIGPFRVDDPNPIPGNSDNALKAWTIAFARAKETDTKQPDAGWLSVYATEKQMILTRLTPRQEQEPEVVEDMFQGYGSLW